MAKTKHTLCGIYKIQHMVSGKVYIGSSINIEGRFRGHRSCLNRGKHHSKFLQNAWDKYGAGSFVFAIVELVRDKSRLHKVEARHIKEFNSLDSKHGYNMCPSAGSLLGIKFGPQSEEHRRKIGQAQQGKQVSNETRAKLSAALKGRTFDEQWIENMRRAQIGRKMAPLSEAHRAIVSAAHKGKVISEEHKQRLREAHTGRKQSEDDKSKKRASAKSYWETLTPEQRTARAMKAAETKRLRAHATPSISGVTVLRPT